MPTETELKARVADLPELRATLCRRGAELVHPRGFEDNYLFDDAESRLSQHGQALRVRLLYFRRSSRDATSEVTDPTLALLAPPALGHDRVILTFKGPRTVDAGVKSREELEVDCDDGKTLMLLLERLGYRRAFRYQKYRETWRFEGVEVMLDDTPIGSFAEIEGTDASVREAAMTLGLTPTVVAESYATLFRQALLARGLSTDAMLFRQDGLPVDDREEGHASRS